MVHVYVDEAVEVRGCCGVVDEGGFGVGGGGIGVVDFDVVCCVRRKKIGVPSHSIDVVDPEVLVVLWGAEGTLLGIRAIDAAGYIIVWYVPDLFPSGLRTRSTENVSWPQIRRCSGRDGTSVRECGVEGRVDAMAFVCMRNSFRKVR